MDLQPGQMLTPTLRLQRQLGRGGMGSIWIADHLALETPVAVKFMAPELVANADVRTRFSREAAAASQVKSPHVVQMLDHGVTAEGIPFIAMELLQGEDLAHRVKRRGLLSPMQLSLVLSQTAKALGRAHERGIVHRDIKPENIFLCESEDDEIFVKVLDFGIAKASDSLSSSTKTGSVMGTAYYMSPEQIVGAKTIDHRTDVWALGVVAYEMMTGVKPFDGETIGALTLAIHGGPLPRPSTLLTGAPLALDEWFARACSRDMNQRFNSARDLAKAFAAVVGADATGARVIDPSQIPVLSPQQMAHPQYAPGHGSQPGYGSQPDASTPPNYGSQPNYGSPPGYGSQPGYVPQPSQPPQHYAPFSATTNGAHAAPPTLMGTTVPKSSNGLIFVLGAAGLLVVGLIVFFATRGDAPPPPPAAANDPQAVQDEPVGKKKPTQKPVHDDDDDDDDDTVASTTSTTTVKPPVPSTTTATTVATVTPTGTGKTLTTSPTHTGTGKTLTTAPIPSTTTTGTSEPKIF